MRRRPGPVIAEERDPSAGVSQEQIEIAVVIDVVELGHRIAAARQAYDGGVDEHKSTRAPGAAVVIPRHSILKLTDDQVGQAIAVEVAQRGRVVKTRARR